MCLVLEETLNPLFEHDVAVMLRLLRIEVKDISAKSSSTPSAYPITEGSQLLLREFHHIVNTAKPSR